MNQNKELVSIIMSVYNGADFIEETINSILKQNYSEFELIIVDDCSTDDTWNILNAFTDKRIIILRNEKNMHLAFSLNRAIKASQGKYVARMDGDDICEPDRFVKQVEYLRSHPDIAVLGGYAQQFGSSTVLMKFPIEHEEIKVELLFTNPMSHPAVMFRSTLIDSWYDSRIIAAQDYELWSRLIWKVQFHNLPTTLIKYRIHDKQTRNLLGVSQKQGAFIAHKNMLDMIGNYTDADAALLTDAGNRNLGKSVDALKSIASLYKKIYADAEKKGDLFQLDILKKRIDKQEGVLIYASLIYKTISWSEVSQTGMAKKFYRRPELVLKALWHKIKEH